MEKAVSVDVRMCSVNKGISVWSVPTKSLLMISLM